MLENPYLEMKDEELINVCKSYRKAQAVAKPCESFLSYAEKIRENDNQITLEEAVEKASRDFFDEFVERGLTRFL